MKLIVSSGLFLKFLESLANPVICQVWIPPASYEKHTLSYTRSVPVLFLPISLTLRKWSCGVTGIENSFYFLLFIVSGDAQTFWVLHLFSDLKSDTKTLFVRPHYCKGVNHQMFLVSVWNVCRIWECNAALACKKPCYDFWALFIKTKTKDCWFNCVIVLH